MDFLTYGTPFMTALGFMLAVAGLILLLWQLNKARKQPTFAWRWATMALVIAALYPIGLGMKITTLGPAFPRWHLSDIGFPVFIGYFVLFHRFWEGFTKHDGEFDPMPRSERLSLYVRYRQWTLLAALGLSYIYECAVGLLYSYTGARIFQIGNFDWLDMLFYTLGAAAGYACLVPLGRAAARIIAAEQLEAEAERRAAAARTPARIPPARLPRRKKR